MAERQIDYLNDVDVRTEIANARAAMVRGQATDTQIALVFVCNRMGDAYQEMDKLTGQFKNQIINVKGLLAMAMEKKVRGIRK